MKKEHILIPKPKSKFQKVKCKECNEENVVFSHSTSQVTCKSCGNIISEPTGSKALLRGEVTGSAE